MHLTEARDPEAAYSSIDHIAPTKLCSPLLDHWLHTPTRFIEFYRPPKLLSPAAALASPAASFEGSSKSMIVRLRPPEGSLGDYHSCKSQSWIHQGHERTTVQPESHLPLLMLAHAEFPVLSASSPLLPCSHTVHDRSLHLACIFLLVHITRTY